MREYFLFSHWKWLHAYPLLRDITWALLVSLCAVAVASGFFTVFTNMFYSWAKVGEGLMFVILGMVSQGLFFGDERHPDNRNIDKSNPSDF